MVGYENVGTSFLNMFQSTHPHRAKSQIASQPRPDHAGIVSEDTLAAQHTTDDRKERCKQCQHQEKGDANHPKIDSIEDSAHVQLDFDANITANFKPRIIFLPKYFHKRVIIALFAVAKEYKYINIYIHE